MRKLFLLSLGLAAFVLSGAVVQYRFFPYSLASDGLRTIRLLASPGLPVAPSFTGFVDTPPQRAAEERISFLAASELAGPVLWLGGRFQFPDLCPEDGCIAVEYDASGEPKRGWPFRLDELEAAWDASAPNDADREFSPAFSFAREARPRSVSRYPDGEDILVVIRVENTFPPGAAVTRIGPDGRSKWFRTDTFPHHWASVTEDGEALVPGAEVRPRSPILELADGPFEFDCTRARLRYDAVDRFDEEGRLVRRYHIMDALLESPYGPVLQHHATVGRGSDPCDITRLNFVQRLEGGADGAWGTAPGDLLVSLRNLSAFAILDEHSGRVKRLVRGSFTHQHGVHHLEGSKFLLFDNFGSSNLTGVSRVLEIDIADGRERTVFPNEETPETARDLFIPNSGHLHLAPDRSRAIVMFPPLGLAVEIRLPDGEATALLRSVHDVSRLGGWPDESRSRSASFGTYGFAYLPR